MPTRILFVAAVMLSVTAQAGTILELVHRPLPGTDTGRVTTTYAQGGQMRVESSDGNGYIIFKGDALYALNNKEHNYTVMDRETLRKMADTINPALKQMRERLEQMPPEQRAQMERMLGGRMGGTEQSPVEVRKTARTDKVAGYSCSYVELVRDGALQDEICVAAPSVLKGGDELMTAAQKASALVQDMFKDLDAPWLKQSVDRQIQNYSQLGGLPILTRHFEDGKPVSESTVRSVRSEAIPAATFEVPAGYTRKELMMHK
ncbi:MAG TPA: hypothetical protein VKB34_13005 [Povalibacter sp.]|nr:hypothetical protein [Povalibacter sp.]